MGFHYIEGGWPGSNPKDMEFFDRIKKHQLKNAVITAFGSTCRPGVEPGQDANLKCLLDSGVKLATIFGKSWDFHVTKALNTTLEENLRMVEESVAFLKGNGLRVFFDAEHFFDALRPMRNMPCSSQAAVLGGAEAVILCDTNGGSMPFEIQQA
ncbi:hypothetical protein N752_10670 [Desulforamulus aquiferis]|nr:hypothetical protein N752_10670 [Desulforamulus aquiferis]